MSESASLSDRVEAQLRNVRDPKADISVFQAGFIENIAIEDREVTIEADLHALDGETATGVVQAMLQAVTDVDGVESAHIERTTPSSEDHASIGAFDHVVAVASAKGGVGKSTVAATLACGLATDHDAALFDADIHGPNVPELLDISGPIHSSEEGDPLPVRTGGLDVMSIGLMEDGAPLAWRGAMAHDAVDDLFANTAWRNDDVLVLDLPPGTGDVVLTTLQEAPVDGVVVVTTPFHASVSDTARTVELFRDNDVPVLGAVVNMAEYVCDCCGEPNDLFDGDALADLDAPTLTELPFSRALQASPTPGSVPDAVAGLREAVIEALETADEVAVESDAVDIRGLPPQERKDRVRQCFTDLESGDSFTLVSDRDPTPVGGFLRRLAGEPQSAFERFDVRRETPDDWVLETVKP